MLYAGYSIRGGESEPCDRRCDIPLSSLSPLCGGHVGHLPGGKTDIGMQVQGNVQENPGALPIMREADIVAAAVLS